VRQVGYLPELYEDTRSEKKIYKKISVPFSRGQEIQEDLEMGPIGCAETSVRNYNYSLRNNPKKTAQNFETLTCLR